MRYCLIVPVLEVKDKLAHLAAVHNTIWQCWECVDTYLAHYPGTEQEKQKMRNACYFSSHIPEKYLATIGLGKLGEYSLSLHEDLERRSFLIVWFDLEAFLSGAFLNALGYYADKHGQPTLVLIALQRPKTLMRY